MTIVFQDDFTTDRASDYTFFGSSVSIKMGVESGYRYIHATLGSTYHGVIDVSGMEKQTDIVMQTNITETDNRSTAETFVGWGNVSDQFSTSPRDEVGNGIYVVSRFNHEALYSKVNGVETLLYEQSGAGLSLTDGKTSWVKFQVEGESVKYKSWTVGGTEPEWKYEGTVTGLIAGRPFLGHKGVSSLSSSYWQRSHFDDLTVEALAGPSFRGWGLPAY